MSDVSFGWSRTKLWLDELIIQWPCHAKRTLLQSRFWLRGLSWPPNEIDLARVQLVEIFSRRHLHCLCNADRRLRPASGSIGRRRHELVGESLAAAHLADG